MKSASRFFTWVLTSATAFLWVAGAGRAQDADPLPGLSADSLEQGRHFPTPPRPARSWNLELLGAHDLGGFGFNTDVWAHGNYAYVGSWGTGSSCLPGGPGTGTKVIDVSDPANPVQVNLLATVPRTLVNDVKVAHIETEFFQGDLLAVSNEDCRARRGARGIELWDVTDPPNAEMLGSLGPRGGIPIPAIDWGGGVHNLYLYQMGGRAFALLVVAGVEAGQVNVGRPATGELKIVEVTDPREPVQLASWGVKQDLGEPVGQISPNGGVFGEDCRPVCRGEDFASIFLHDVWANAAGTVAYLSYWDAGVILLDISDPSHPMFLGRGNYLDDEGNTHAAVPAQGGNLVIVGDEDFTADPFGFLRVFDTVDPGNPVEVGQFHAEHTFGDPPDDGWYSIHNMFVRGSTVYIAWYSEGIRLLDISAPAAPREIAAFVPPAIPDPRGFLPTQPLVWGVYVHGDLIFASDINAGLYILKRRRMDVRP